MEIVKSKKINLVVLLFSVLFLLFCGCAFGQEMSIERSVSYNPYYKKNIVTKYPSYNLEFTKGKDTTFMSIFADSLSADRFGVRIYVFFPKNTSLSNSIIKLGFEDGSEDYVKAFDIDYNNNYVEYALPQNVFSKLYRLRVTSVQFNYDNKINKIEDSLFFFAFLSRHNN